MMAGLTFLLICSVVSIVIGMAAGRFLRKFIKLTGGMYRALWVVGITVLAVLHLLYFVAQICSAGAKGPDAGYVGMGMAFLFYGSLPFSLTFGILLAMRPPNNWTAQTIAQMSVVLLVWMAATWVIRFNPRPSFSARVLNQNGEPVAGAVLELQIDRADQKLLEVPDLLYHMLPKIGSRNHPGAIRMASDSAGWFRTSNIPARGFWFGNLSASNHIFSPPVTREQKRVAPVGHQFRMLDVGKSSEGGEASGNVLQGSQRSAPEAGAK